MQLQFLSYDYRYKSVENRKLFPAPQKHSFRKQRKKVRNSSLILPAVIQRIAQLRGEPAEAVEQAIYQNTLRVFRLDQA